MEDWGLAHDTIEHAGTVNTKNWSSSTFAAELDQCKLLRGYGVVPAAFSLPETRPNRPDRSVPIAFKAVMMATAMPAAIRPYSMAVAPDSSLTKRVTKVLIRHSL